MRPRSTSFLFIAAGLAGVLASSLAAQVPDGWAVASSFRSPPSFGQPGDGGLWLVHPVNPTIAIPVTGLPASVTGCPWPGAQFAGADFVLRRTDGSLVVNGWPYPAPAGTSMLVHVLQLSGSAVSAVQTYNAGTIQSSSFLGIPQAANLPDGRVLLALDRVGIPGEPFDQCTLGILDLNHPPGNPQAFVPIPLGGWTPSSSEQVNAVAVDPSGHTAWFAMEPKAGIGATIYQASLRNPNAPPVPFASLPANLSDMTWDPTTSTLVGSVVGRAGSGSPNLYRLDPASGTATPISSSLAIKTNGVAVEPATGDLLVVSNQINVRSQIWRIPGSGGTATLLSNGPPAGYNACPATAAGWATLGGIDLNPDPETYGTVTPGNNTYRWQVAPNPGGLPLAGSATFSITVTSSPGPMQPGFWCISPVPAPPGTPPPLNIPASALLSPWPLSPGGTIPFPFLPPFLRGTTVYFQGFLWDPGAPGSIATTEGLEVTIL